MQDLPFTLPKYVDNLPPTTFESNARTLKINQIKDFENVVKLRLQCKNSTFRLPSGLQHIIWRESSISNFSCDFTILSRLTSIDISFNSLSSLPPLPQCLQILKVSHNHLTALEFYHNMTNLRAIHASFNKIEHVSDSIKKFEKLQSLRLNDNCIAKMPNLSQLNLIELDLRNNHFTKLPIINDTITNFKIDGNLFVYSGPFLGNKHILKDNMFKRKAKSLPEIHPPVVAIETTSDQITSFASKSQTSQLSVQSKSSQIKSSRSSENIIKSDIIPTSASEPNLNIGDKSTKNKLDARRIALKNFVEIQKENLSVKKEEVILNLVRSILRKDLLETQEDDLKDGILFIRCYNLRRKRTFPALIVELPAPRETVLSLNKSRRNAEKLVEAASQNGFKLTVEDIMELNQEKLIPFLLFLTKK